MVYDQSQALSEIYWEILGGNYSREVPQVSIYYNYITGEVILFTF